MNTNSNWSSDEPITAAIERQIQARMQPHTSPIDVSAAGATVTLTGHVANQATKDALIQLARDTDGVIVIPAGIAAEISDETTDMTAYEDFVTERVRSGATIIGLYPATDPANLDLFRAWRAQYGR